MVAQSGPAGPAWLGAGHEAVREQLQAGGVTSNLHIFDRQLLWRRRDRFALDAARHEFLLARVAADLMERLTAVRRTFPLVLNLGAHHGLVGRHLRRLGGVETIIDAEPSSKLLALCTGLRVRCD